MSNLLPSDVNKNGNIDWSESELGKAISRLFSGARDKITSLFSPTPTKLIDPTATGINRVMPQTAAVGPQVAPQTRINTLMPSPTPTPQPTVQMSARNPAFSKFKVPQIVHNAIQSAAKEFKLPVSLLYDIALQESGFNPNLKNPSRGSTASGLFQFTKDTWDTVNNYARASGSSLKNWTGKEDRFDPFANARAAAYLIKMGQLGRWDASKGVWGQHYSPGELKSYYSQTR